MAERPLRLISSVTLSAPFFAAIVLASSQAIAQPLAPPPPIDPGAPGSPNAPPPPGQPMPGQPGAPGMPPGTSSTDTDLNLAEQEDSGRSFELVWVNADAGGSYVNMQQFSSDAAIVKSSSGGPMFSLGAGLRLVILYVGARVKLTDTSAFSMWQVNGEAGFRFPIKKWDISIGAHGGYAFLGGIDSGAVSADDTSSSGQVSVHGFDAGADFGVDYFLTSIFSIGAGISADFLFLKRPPVPIPANVPAAQMAQIQSDPLYQSSGSTAGFGVNGGLRLGLHFGF